MEKKKKALFKIVIVGDGGVGKSTMVQRLTTGRFIPQKITIGTDLATYDLLIDEYFDVRLQIWDFAGERRFRLFLPNYSRGATGCLLCYDITRRTSFDSLEEWFEIVNGNADNPVFILVGEKLDLADIRRSVEYDQAEKFKEKYNIDYFFETSSKSGENNEMIFETLTRSILKQRDLIK
jgi:small GTP-binding protein